MGNLIEARTEELSNRLFALSREYRPGFAERRQDWLMDQMARDPVLRSRVLRFVDVLAALDFDRDSRELKKLFREYFAGPFPRALLFLRFLLLAGRQPAMPARLLSLVSRGMVYALASRFIAGTGPAAIPGILEYLEKQGRSATFDLLGEEVLSEHEADLYKMRYLGMIDRLVAYSRSGSHAMTGQISLKLSSLTGNFNPIDPEGTLGRVQPRIMEIVQRCIESDIGLNIDAEQFEYREVTWHIFSSVFGPGSPLAHWERAGITVQSYLKDSAGYLETVLEFAGRRGKPFQIRLVKGAYWDYEVITARQNHWPVPVFEQKRETDRNFQVLLETLLKNSPRVITAVAGHNLIDHARAQALRESLGLAPEAVEHQTLFRTAEGISRALRRMGWPVRDYVPSGELVPGMAYLVRRVLENTSLWGFLLSYRSGAKVVRRVTTATQTMPSGTPGAPEAMAFGFQNQPPRRLFIAGERADFESSLGTARMQWGQGYPIRIGNRELRGLAVKVSLSPSHPDLHHPVGLVHMAGMDEARHAIALARHGFVRWSGTLAAERARLLHKAANHLALERDSLAAWIVDEGGRTRTEALADVDEAIDHLAYQAERLVLNVGRITEQGYQPRGVVAVISPWNFPSALPVGMIAGALAAGNSVILKSAEQTPIIAARLVEALHAAGIPPEILVHLPGWGEVVGDYLVGSPEVDMVAFTGSKAAGISIYRKASSVRPVAGLKKVIAEMGGKNAIIVCADADLDEAVKGVLLSAFEHANQKCSACSRVFVDRRILKRFGDRLAHAVESLPVGPADDPGTLMNPLIEDEARQRVMAYVQKARNEGRVLIDRVRTGSSNPLQIGPLVVELEIGQLAKSTIAQQEIFGPVLVLVAFDDKNEMLEQVNGTAYALTAGVFSRSPQTIARMVRGVRAGNIYVNRKITGARVGIEPFGGFQLSGTGPKAGGADYLFAFLTRREDREQSYPPDEALGDLSLPELARTVEPWSAGVAKRAEVLRRCVGLLGRQFQSDLQKALQYVTIKVDLDTAGTARRVVAVAASVVESVAEILEHEPMITLPGQKNWVDWQTPRGTGFVASDGATPPERFAGMVFGPLLAGNGLIVAPAIALQPLAMVLLRALHRAGVPREVLGIAPHGGPEAAVWLANDMFHFAVTDMGIEETARIYKRLGVTREEQGQRWIKALISMQDGRRPGEEGFLRQFALPKAIAIRTLRHGADLELP